MFTTLVIGGLCLVAALAILSHWACYRAGREDGYEQGRADRREGELAERKAERHEARHARTAPRRAPERTSLVQDDPPEPERVSWDRPEAVGGPVEIPGKWYADYMRTRMAAANVVLPEPGTYLPQPGRDSGPGTETLTRLELPATTGEMAAVTDDYIAQMAVDEETFRLGLAT